LDYDSGRSGGAYKMQNKRGGQLDKFTELYMKAKPMKEKRDKSLHDYEYEKGI
jgi:hypothetical protein